MDLRQLEILTAVAEEHSFSGAARALHTAQSNISAHVAKLEDELGTILVDRSAGRLTPAGAKVVERARRIRGELDAINDDVMSMTSQVSGQVRLGMIGTSAGWIVPILLDRQQVEFRAIKVRLIESVTSSLVPQLLTGQLDLAVVNLPLRDREIRSTPLFAEEVVVIAPTSHPLGQESGAVSFRTLADHELLLGPPGTSLRNDIDSVAMAAGVRLRTRAEVDGVRLNATLAFQGFAPTLVPSTAVPVWMEHRGFVVRPVSEQPRRRVGLAQPRRGLPSAATSAVRELLIDLVAANGGEVQGIETAL